MFGLFCPAYVSEIHSCCISCLFLFICLPVLHYAKIKVLFIHSPANEYLGCFQFSTVMNTACHEHLCSHFCVAISFLLGIPRNEIECRGMLSFFVGGGGGGFFYFLFIFFINYQIVSQSGCAFLQFLLQYVSIPAAPHGRLALAVHFSHSDGYEVVSHSGFRND